MIKRTERYIGISLAIMAMMGNIGTPTSKYEEEDFKPKVVKKVIPNGCKEFTIDGITVVAISEKSAINKVERLSKK